MTLRFQRDALLPNALYHATWIASRHVAPHPLISSRAPGRSPRPSRFGERPAWPTQYVASTRGCRRGLLAYLVRAVHFGDPVGCLGAVRGIQFFHDFADMHLHR